MYRSNIEDIQNSIICVPQAPGGEGAPYLSRSKCTGEPSVACKLIKYDICQNMWLLKSL